MFSLIITILLVLVETIITIKTIKPKALQMYLSKLICLSSVLFIFPRALKGLRAAHLNQQVVVTGGADNGRNARDEV